MAKPFDVVALLSSAVIVARKAETFSPEIYVIDLAELREIAWEMQQNDEQKASCWDDGSRVRRRS
jgi:hypothetical protein